MSTALLDAMGKLIFLRGLKPFQQRSVTAWQLVHAVNEKRTNGLVAELHEPMRTKLTRARQKGRSHLAI